ncbi:5-hydroxytryptamine receptor 2C [Dufourea novaeangliae]|uniref:5-hydroxytryptamine receptor 2C n=1 Tax=Dufourea novaeangliae TaxID=178035 RepID=A0A154P1V1_DUFNO|nr:5-hydroxytryptamine receptor 2C [Dufourea novaeangliae]
MIGSSVATIDPTDPPEAVDDTCFEDLLFFGGSNETGVGCDFAVSRILNDTRYEIEPTNGTRLDIENDGLNNWWAMLALVLVLGTAAGNILVCLAIARERRLQNVTNYFLMSLAITDLMVAVLVMPLGILTLVRGKIEYDCLIAVGGIPMVACGFSRIRRSNADLKDFLFVEQ